MVIRTKATTLMEMLVILIIIGILATLAFPAYNKMQENTYDQEAIANLKLINSAQKIHRMENDDSDYYDSGIAQPTAITNINTQLKLLLPENASRKWDFITGADNAANPETCCAQATRTGATPRYWSIRNTEVDPVVGTCP